MIQVLSPFKFKDLKAVPWQYDCQAIMDPSVNYIKGIDEITWNERCYKPDNLIAPSSSLILEQGRKNDKRNVNKHDKE